MRSSSPSWTRASEIRPVASTSRCWAGARGAATSSRSASDSTRVGSSARCGRCRTAQRGILVRACDRSNRQTDHRMILAIEPGSSWLQPARLMHAAGSSPDDAVGRAARATRDAAHHAFELTGAEERRRRRPYGKASSVVAHPGDRPRDRAGRVSTCCSSQPPATSKADTPVEGPANASMSQITGRGPGRGC
jgi:hypothetical protein